MRFMKDGSRGSTILGAGGGNLAWYHGERGRLPLPENGLLAWLL